MIVLSHIQIAPLIAAWAAGQGEALTSPDLNLSEIVVRLDPDGIHYPGGVRLAWDDAERIASAKNTCFRLENAALHEIRAYSEVTHWIRSLYPTAGAPSMLVSGMVMHRVEGVDPHQDTLNKIAALGPVHGDVLDTATGLGYTAIQAARTARRVVTVEIDPASIEIARQNPWSQDLFGDACIELIIGHVWDVVEEMNDTMFSAIIHDPPTFSLAGDLYSGDFYREMYRVLKRNGRLFHYLGDPDSKSVQQVQRGVMRRLAEAGFARVERKPRAFGVVAYK